MDKICPDFIISSFKDACAVEKFHGKWMTADTEENYKKVIRTTEVPYGPNDIEYKYNNYGFRCDDFDSWEKFPYRILYAGCSMTEGIGLPLDDIWPKLMHKRMCEEYNIEMPYWTIASGGTGLDQMVRYLYNLKDLIRPQIILCYLPGKERRELWYEERWGTWVFDKHQKRKYNFDQYDTKVFTDERYVEYQTEKNLAMLEMILKELNCLFLFSSSMDDFKITDYLNSSYFVQRPHNPEQYDISRDGIHAGPVTNKIMAERAFEFFNPIIKKKLGL